MDDNIRRVLQLLQDGKITAKEAETLISALTGAHAPPAAPPVAPIEKPQWAADTGGTASDSRTTGLATGDLLLQIAEDPSIAEHEKVTLIVHATALICTAMALQPIPGVDIFILTPIQVASVMAMSHVMGSPIGKNGAGEIVASVVAVVGWGAVAEQFVLAGAKLFMPLFGGIVLIPLIYGTVYGFGCAARAVLEARRGSRQLSDIEIRQIKEEAERRAKAEKRDWSARAEAYKQYEAHYSEEQANHARLRQDLEVLSERFSALTERKVDLEQRLRTATERLKEGLDALTDLERTQANAVTDQLTTALEALVSSWQSEGAELEVKQNEYDAVNQRLEILVSDRFHTCYPRLSFTPDALAALAVMPYASMYLAERQISLLQHDAARADYLDISITDRDGVAVLTIGYDEDRRLYISNSGDKVVVRWAGTRLHQEKDIQRLRERSI